MIVWVGATWCHFCQGMKGPWANCLKHYGDRFVFIEVDQDQCPEIAKWLKVDGVPQFTGFKNGKLVVNKTGAMPEAQLRKFMERIEQA